MNPIYPAALVLHIIGITVMGGATVVDYLGFRTFWATLLHDKPRAIVHLQTGTLYQRLMGIGMLLIIISGVTMMVFMHAVWGQQMWFKIKFALLFIVIINGLGIRRMLGSKLNKSIHSINAETEMTLTFSKIRRNISLVHGLQFILFVAIFILSVFKFN